MPANITESENKFTLQLRFCTIPPLTFVQGSNTRKGTLPVPQEQQLALKRMLRAEVGLI